MPPEALMITMFEAKHLWTILVRLLFAVAAGVVLGFPFRFRPGGLRTHALVTTGTALFCILGVGLREQYGSDLVQIIQGIIQGIGFIGAATVIKLGGYIIGVNTAASILLAAAVGCFIGVGHPLFGLLIAPFAMGINLILRLFEERIMKGRDRRLLR